MQHVVRKDDLRHIESRMLKWQVGRLITVINTSNFATTARVVSIMMR